MIEAPEAPHHHNHAGIPWFDIMMGVAILCISVASLLTSLQSEKSMHALVEQNTRLVDAQSTPLLMLDSGNMENGKPVLTMTISNVGTGPAQIAWYRATDAEGNSFSGSAIEQRVFKLDPKLHFMSEVINSTLMRSGDQRTVFSWPKPTDNSAALGEWDRVNQARFHLHASACYCSIFDECKITEFGSGKPKPVESCAQDQDKRNP
ncbi:MAG TPA: hypothetical protein VGU46_00945 [Acidobacteriaceae bacterium]|nr:hypothetical protein [Acidobacteriaceae bacterium]